MPRLKDLTLKEIAEAMKGFLWLAVSGLVAWGLNAWLLSVGYEQLAHFFAVLRDALFIAFLLAVAVDAWAKDRLVRDAAQDISHHLIGWGLPNALQGHIKEIVQHTNIVRERYEARFRLDPSAPDGNVYLHIEVSYDVRNYASTDVTYVPTLAIEGVYQPILVSFDCHPQTGEPYTRDRMTLPPDVDASDVHSYRGQPTVIRQEGKPCRVRWRYRQTMLKWDSDILTFSGATLGATVDADVPVEYQFLTSSDPRRIAAEGGTRWMYDRPYIEGQHIRLWWRLRV